VPDAIALTSSDLPPPADSRPTEAGPVPASLPTSDASPDVVQPPRDAIRTIVSQSARAVAIAAVAFVVFVLWLSGLAHARRQVGLQRRFRAELAAAAAPVSGDIPAGAPVAILQIPRVGLDEVVVEGSRSSQLLNGPGHLVGTPLPGQPGNAVLGGRRRSYGGPFGRLGSLHSGDRIDVTTGEGNVTYRVTGVANLAGTDASFVQYRNDNRLTLFTSNSTWDPTGRLVVTATLDGNPLPATTRSGEIDPAALGLIGDRSAAPSIHGWLELLAAAALAAAYAATRWSRLRTWLFFSPVLVLLTWQVFMSLMRLLPGTI
jgi:sortase A